MEGSVVSFLKAERKMSDTGSAHWTSSLKRNADRAIVKVKPTCTKMSNII